MVAVRRVLWWGLALGLVGTSVDHIVAHLLRNTALPFSPLLSESANLLGDLGTKALSFSYAAGLVILAQQATWRSRLAPLAAVGHMSLSNYVLQSAIAGLIVYPYGLGHGPFGPVTGVVLTLLIFPLQVMLSVWWMTRFRFGPVEWLWRTLAEGTLQPMVPIVRRPATGVMA